MTIIRPETIGLLILETIILLIGIMLMINFYMKDGKTLTKNPEGVSMATVAMGSISLFVAMILGGFIYKYIAGPSYQ